MISLVIPTKNEQQNITNCLESIKQQNFNTHDIEIIVVDNNSDDQTKETARQYTLHHKDAGLAVKVFNFGSERSAQRNFGARQAQGEILGFIDADMILSPGVISEVAEKFTHNKNLAGLYINEQVVNSLNPLKSPKCHSFFCRLRNFERQFYDQTPIDAVRFIRRDDFFTIGGFDENLFACEDWDFTARIKRIAQGHNGRFNILKSVVYHNESDLTLKKLLQKKRYYSSNFQNYINKWGRNDPNIKKQFSARYRLCQVFIENGKWRRLLYHPILAIAMFVSKILIGIIYLFSLKLGIARLPSLSFPQKRESR